MAKSNILNQEWKKLTSLWAWHQYYQACNNPVKAGIARRQAEEQSFKYDQMKNGRQ